MGPILERTEPSRAKMANRDCEDVLLCVTLTYINIHISQYMPRSNALYSRSLPTPTSKVDGYHLTLLGVLPALQGKGVGGKLVLEGQERVSLVFEFIARFSDSLGSSLGTIIRRYRMPRHIHSH